MFEDGLDCLKDWKRNLLLGIAILDFSKLFNPRFGVENWISKKWKQIVIFLRG